ncbi:MAG: hypothetical protein IJZ86_02670 [Bacteroides sp.]|nr:hypothetical protein [Bacteroides sp.]
MKEYPVLNINRLITEKSIHEYSDDNLAITCNLKGVFQSTPAFRSSFFGVFFCAKGSVQFNFNGREQFLQRNQVCIFFPTNLLSEALFSPDCHVWTVGITQVFFNGIIRRDKLADNTIAYLYNNPIHRLEAFGA